MFTSPDLSQSLTANNFQSLADRLRTSCDCSLTSCDCSRTSCDCFADILPARDRLVCLLRAAPWVFFRGLSLAFHCRGEIISGNRHVCAKFFSGNVLMCRFTTFTLRCTAARHSAQWTFSQQARSRCRSRHSLQIQSGPVERANSRRYCHGRQIEAKRRGLVLDQVYRLLSHRCAGDTDPGSRP